MPRGDALTLNNAPFRRLHVVVASALIALVMAAGWAIYHAQASVPPKTVELALVAGKTDANGTFNFNGYAKGALTLTIPVGWRVLMHYKNESGLRHSLDVISYTGTQPDKAPPPAFTGASTRDLTDGIGAGHEEPVTFVASRAGRFEFLCGVLGHAQAGMWDFLMVSPTAKAPSVRPAAAAALKVR